MVVTMHQQGGLATNLKMQNSIYQQLGVSVQTSLRFCRQQDGKI